MKHNSDIFENALALAKPRVAIAEQKPKENVHFDNAGEGEGDAGMTGFDLQQIEFSAVAVVQEWAETSSEDLAEGEGFGDRLLMLLIGIADENIDGEISDDEYAVFEAAANAAADYMAMNGVSEEDISKLLDGFDNDVAAAVQAQVIEKMPNGDDAGDQMDTFVMQSGDGGEDVALDAVYKKKIAFRKGKKVWVNKRIAGKVRLSAAQKAGIKKAQRKAFSAGAKMRRAKSMRMRVKAGM